MKKLNVVWYVLVSLLAWAALLAFNADIVWSSSVDLAHHYALIFRLSESWQLVPNDPSLGEMNIYPRGSHAAAALAGMAVGSPFLGMHLVAISSLVLLWGACLAILYAAPNRTGPWSALALALVVVINHAALRVHGAEISNAYHYAQLVGQALAFAALAMAIRLDGRVHRLAVYAFLLLAIYVVLAVHLLPALELLGVLAGVLLLDVIAAARKERLRMALVAAVVLAIGIASVLSHPTFTAMRLISSFNGGMALGILGPMWSLVVVCLIILASVVPLLRAWHRDPAANAMYKYVAIYGVTVAGLCLLQMVLRYVGLGSDYAVKKYAYVLGTFLVLRLAIWIGASMTARAERRPKLARLSTGTPFKVALFGVTLVATVLGSARMRHELDTFKVVDLERQMIALRAAGLPAPPEGKHNVVANLDGMPLVIPYMFSLAITNTSRDVAPPYWNDGGHLGDLARFGVIVSAQNSAAVAAAGARCARGRSGALVMLEAACVVQAQAQTGAAAGPAP